MSPAPIKCRFAPSPTGHLHIGGARTALLNWLFARHYGGVFVLRIEDTDVERNVSGAEQKIADDLAWLGLSPDESPWTGGPDAPYRQSERLETYTRYADKLIDSGHAYFSFDTPEELTAMRDIAKREKRNFKYPRPAAPPSREDAAKARAEGRPVVIRMKSPDKDITVNDRVLGDVTISAAEMEDFVILKNNGYPTYHFAVVVDDEMMHITHVLRAQEHLMNTPKHIALQDALGFRRPEYGHVPIVMNIDGTKMSKRDKHKVVRQAVAERIKNGKWTVEELVRVANGEGGQGSGVRGQKDGAPIRADGASRRSAVAGVGRTTEGAASAQSAMRDPQFDLAAATRWLDRSDIEMDFDQLARVADALGVKPPEIEVHDFRKAGYLPEAVLNFIALLGWSPGEDREKMTPDEMIRLFTVERIGKTASRFDREKLLSFNTDACAAATPERLRAAFRDYAQVAGSPLAKIDDATLDRVLAACKGFRTFRDVDHKVGPLFAPDESIVLDPDAVRKVLEKPAIKGTEITGDALLAKLLPALEAITPWSAEPIDTAIKAFCESNACKLGDVAQPMRVALTGRTISPTISETLMLLGKEKSLSRVKTCIGRAR